MYIQNEPRIAFFKSNDDFLLDKFEELLEIDLSDIGNTVVVFTWIGFPGWKTSKTIKDVFKGGYMTVETIHAIKALLDNMSQSYMCLEHIYLHPEE